MALGISDYHKSAVVNYLRFARYQRGQRLRSVDACFREVEHSRLNDEDATYTHGEVEDLIKDAESQVRNEVENELINTVHTNVALLVQLFKQAENWRLKLEADVSELENRDLLESIRAFEENEFHGKTFDDKSGKSSKRLEPLNEGGAALLKAEIKRLESENEELRSRMKQIERDAVGRGNDSGGLREENARLRRELERLGAGSSRRGDDDEELNSLRGELSRMKTRDGASRSELDSEITALKHELLRIRSTLELAEAELERKVSETTPFKNIKRMLMSKNDQVKDLRRRLSRYEKVDDE